MKEILAIRDKKANVYLPPFFTDNANTARRSLALPANSDESFIGLYPEDYDVYRLGHFDEQTGRFDILPAAEFCFSVSELVKKQPSDSADVEQSYGFIKKPEVKTDVKDNEPANA